MMITRVDSLSVLSCLAPAHPYHLNTGYIFTMVPAFIYRFILLLPTQFAHVLISSLWVVRIMRSSRLCAYPCCLTCACLSPLKTYACSLCNKFCSTPVPVVFLPFLRVILSAPFVSLFLCQLGGMEVMIAVWTALSLDTVSRRNMTQQCSYFISVPCLTPSWCFPRRRLGGTPYLLCCCPLLLAPKLVLPWTFFIYSSSFQFQFDLLGNVSLTPCVRV